MSVRGFLTLGALLALAGNISLVAWWAVDSADWSFIHIVQYSGYLVFAALFSLIAIWTVEPAARGGILLRVGVIGLHLGALGFTYFVTYISFAIPPMLVIFVSMAVAFARFVRTPLPARV